MNDMDCENKKKMLMELHSHGNSVCFHRRRLHSIIFLPRHIYITSHSSVASELRHIFSNEVVPSYLIIVLHSLNVSSVMVPLRLVVEVKSMFIGITNSSSHLTLYAPHTSQI